MRVDYQQVITETPEQLKQIQSAQKKISDFQKVQGLYLLKSGQVKTLSNLADYLGVHRVTVQRWLKSYREQGLRKLLTAKPKTGRPKTIKDSVLTHLKEKLKEPEIGFSSYKQIQHWLENKYQIQLNYHTVYHWVRRKWKAKLKVPRPSAVYKNEKQAEQFKKNSQNC